MDDMNSGSGDYTQGANDKSFGGQDSKEIIIVDIPEPKDPKDITRTRDRIKHNKGLLALFLAAAVTVAVVVLVYLFILRSPVLPPAPAPSTANTAANVTPAPAEPTPEPTPVERETVNGIECMTLSEAQRLFPGISSEIKVPVDVDDCDDFNIQVKGSAYKRYTWHVYNDGKKHNFGTVNGDSKSFYPAVCCATYVDTNGKTEYLVYYNSEYFWTQAGTGLTK